MTGKSAAPMPSLASPMARLIRSIFPAAVSAAVAAAPPTFLATSAWIAARSPDFRTASSRPGTNFLSAPTLPVAAFAMALDAASKSTPRLAAISIAVEARLWALATSPVAIANVCIAGRSLSSAIPRALPWAVIQSSVAAICALLAPVVLVRDCANIAALFWSSMAALEKSQAARARPPRAAAAGTNADWTPFLNFAMPESSPRALLTRLIPSMASLVSEPICMTIPGIAIFSGTFHSRGGVG